MLTQHTWESHAIAAVSWEKDDRVKVGLVGRKTLRFQFLNTESRNNLVLAF